MSKKGALDRLEQANEDLYLAARTPAVREADRLAVGAAVSLGKAADEMLPLRALRKAGAWAQRTEALVIVVFAATTTARALGERDREEKQHLLEVARREVLEAGRTLVRS